VVVQLV